MIEATGKLNVRLSEIPLSATKLDKGQRTFAVQVAGLTVHVVISKKSWNAFVREHPEGLGPNWTAFAEAPIEPAEDGSLRFAQPSGLQLFERKPKPATAEDKPAPKPQPAASPTPAQKPKPAKKRKRAASTAASSAFRDPEFFASGGS